MRRVALSLITFGALQGCASVEPAPPAATEETGFEFLTSGPRPTAPPTATFRAPPPPAPTARASNQAASSIGACNGKIGSALAAQLEEAMQAHVETPILVSAEFQKEKEGDEVPGLDFVAPHMGTGPLAPKVIVKLCANPDLIYIDAAPKSFIRR